MTILAHSAGAYITERPKVSAQTVDYLVCNMFHCDKPKHPDVGIALCANHLQKAWAAYMVVNGDSDQSLVPLPEPAPRDVHTSTARGFVYFARVGELIKIGWTHDVRKRMIMLKADALLHSQPGTREDESAMHAIFREHRHHGRDWFNSHADILRHIKRLHRAA